MDPKAWIGKAQEIHDPMDPWAAAALVATLELERPVPGPGDPLPLFWHWLYFREAFPRSALGPDGHPAVGGFMPKVAQPRRMWAGGRLRVSGPLALGAPAVKRSTIAEVAEKTGRAGEMTFVTVRHEISGGGGLVVTEEQDVVYRHDPMPGTPRPAPKQAPTDEDASRDWCCDATVLFRYSALTFNGHKIHYDRSHAQLVEGYPGLVVHGPLLATLLLDLVRETGEEKQVTGFDFRATAPVFADEPFTCCMKREDGARALWVRGGDGRLAMQARAALAVP